LTAGQGEIDVAAYFPIRQGDAWTYEYSLRIGDGPLRQVKRTRAFEGRELINTGQADKLASETGDYALFSLNEQGLHLHGAAEYERGARFLFDPPVVILTRQMKVGQPIVMTQPEEDGQQTRQFTTVLEGVAAIDTPMGKFNECLKVRWEMDGSLATQKTTYYFAKGVGIVAYQVEARNKKRGGVELLVDARLKLAQLHGRNFSSAAELKPLASPATTPAALTDNPKARAIFRQASENRYGWDKKFPGFEAEFRLVRDGGAPVNGTLRVDRQLAVTVTCPDPTARAIAHAEVSQFVTHRHLRPFDEVYGPGKATFGFSASDAAEGEEILLNDEEAMGSSYLIRDREIVRVSRSYGRVRFVTNHVKSVKTDDGRYLASEYEITYFSNETGAVVSQTKFHDRYDKTGAYWLPVGRTKVESARGKTATLELSLSNLRYLK
jgi:hypothetical protein